MGDTRPTAPILDGDLKDPKIFYHNAAYKTNRVAINLEKMKVLKERLGDCVREEGVNYIDKCEQLTRRYEAIVRVCQWQSGKNQRARNVGGILDREKDIKAELRAEGALA
ncbi:hypothetical protein MNEG_4583 [Monoraphidium neglectum]|uniref:Uncharacterized protein n=1 Tax=Monoraphidium neglectum TaxID=145388 RepID=A0A0D2L948_9CHLO|nr:hypothetical protein MNEG_4583 [Monoraphidium neglectum]KIZ03379.1 hypothetical protein MNEG_4583 [Monoraphidium neglectum]|eukprot:XP_013902398.1 hypothetical protein MNEG_4583 [Monoraphidium neglectum]